MDLMREILLHVEALPTPQSIELVEVSGYDQEEVSYHVKLLGDAGYLDIYDLRTLGPDGFRYAPSALTNTGHDFLDGMRNSSVWDATKARLLKIGGSAPLDVVRAVMTAVIKERLFGQ